MDHINNGGFENGNTPWINSTTGGYIKTEGEEVSVTNNFSRISPTTAIMQTFSFEVNKKTTIMISTRGLVTGKMGIYNNDFTVAYWEVEVNTNTSLDWFTKSYDVMPISEWIGPFNFRVSANYNEHSDYYLDVDNISIIS